MKHQVHIKRMRIPAAVAIVIMLAMTTFSQTRVYKAERWNDNNVPDIDGVLSETGWSGVPWHNDFIQHAPYEDQPPSQVTAFRILYDDDNLYVAIRAYDAQPEKIEKRLSRRDQAGGDYVAVAFDSYFDRLTSFYFGVNAAGVKKDQVFTNDIEQDNTWNPVWWVAVSSDSMGWLAEMKIPFSQLRFASKDIHTWGLQVTRFLHRAEELSLWQPVPADANAWVSRYGTLEGIRGIKPRKEVELVPYVMGSIDRYESEEGDPFKTGKEFDYSVGLDGKMALTNDLTLNFTVNPDFGQVEADPSEVNLTAYETFFPEKRPFFVEGSNIFDYQLTLGNGHMSKDNLFYSRRIGRSPQHNPELKDNEKMDCAESAPILGAFKLSGKTRKGWSVGVMNAFTGRVSAQIDSEGTRRDEVVEPYTNYFNARIQKDINKGSTVIGGMATATDRWLDSAVNMLPGAAYSQGVDFEQYWKNKTYHLKAKIVTSQVRGSREAITGLQKASQRYYQRPDAGHLELDTTLTSLTGHGGTITGGKLGNGRIRYMGYVSWRSPGLELNDQGYLRQADLIQQVLWGQYRLWEPKGIYRNFYLTLNMWTGWDFGGNMLYQGINASSQIQMKNFWTFGSGVSRQSDLLNRSELRGGPAIRVPGEWNLWLWLTSDERKKITFALTINNNWGDHASARLLNVSPSIAWRPVKALSVAAEPSFYGGYQAMQYIKTVRHGEEDRYILGKIDMNMLLLNLRVDLSLTPELSIQYWGQPFIFAGDYSEFKKTAEPASSRYADTYHLFGKNEILYDEGRRVYEVDDNADGSVDYRFSNPDFKVYEFRSNLVLRWEYIPGSTVYLVWSQGRIEDVPQGRFNFREDIAEVFCPKPRNVVMVKFSYRLSV